MKASHTEAPTSSEITSQRLFFLTAMLSAHQHFKNYFEMTFTFDTNLHRPVPLPAAVTQQAEGSVSMWHHKTWQTCVQQLVSHLRARVLLQTSVGEGWRVSTSLGYNNKNGRVLKNTIIIGNNIKYGSCTQCNLVFTRCALSTGLYYVLLPLILFDFSLLLCSEDK